MNRVTIRQPIKLAVSNSCPFGIGGFLLDGRAWRVWIPKFSPFYRQLIVDFLEFLDIIVNVWLMCLEFTAESCGRQHVRDRVDVLIQLNLQRSPLL
jgi:hypothetical protein